MDFRTLDPNQTVAECLEQSLAAWEARWCVLEAQRWVCGFLGQPFDGAEQERLEQIHAAALVEVDSRRGVSPAA